MNMMDLAAELARFGVATVKTDDGLRVPRSPLCVGANVVPTVDGRAVVVGLDQRPMRSVAPVVDLGRDAARQIAGHLFR